MSASDIDVSVVVVNYRTPRDLKRFVDSYMWQSSDVSSELIIVDVDPTTDMQYEAREFLSKYDFEFQYWPFDYNCGYGKACNFASTVASGLTYAFFNADTELHDKTLDECHHALWSHDDWAILGPQQVNRQGRVTHAGIFGTNTSCKPRGWKSRHPDQFVDVRDDAISVSGSAYFIKAHVWEELANHPRFVELYPEEEGAFLPTPHYYEETWVSYFARHLGYRVVYLGTSQMSHEWHQASQVGSVERSCMATSRRMFREACDHFGIDHD